MKKVFKIFIVAYLLFTSLFVNASEIGFVAGNNVLNNVIQAESSSVPSYKNTSNAEKHIAPVSRTDSAVIFSSKDNDFNTTFGEFKGGLLPANHQFSLLVSYLYNKSYLENAPITSNKPFFTEICPNAP